MKLVIIRGLPGSGKTTMAKTLKRLAGYSHFEADMYFERGGSFQFDPTKLSEAHAWCLQSVKDAIDKRENVVVSNTFVRCYIETLPYIDYAYSSGYLVEIIEAKGNYKSVHNVPEATIQRMRKNWEQSMWL